MSSNTIGSAIELAKNGIPLGCQTLLRQLPESAQAVFIDRFTRKKKELWIAYLCWVFPTIGFHYGYLNRWGTQVAYWLTLHGLFVWQIVDLFRMKSLVAARNDEIAMQLLQELAAQSTGQVVA
jgi:hypothetical protein